MNPATKAAAAPEGDELSPYFCTHCGTKIPWARFWKKGSTCSDECATAIRQVRRRRRDSRYCRLCNKPSTLEQRALWREFARERLKMKRGRRPKAKKVLAETEPAGAI